MFNLQIVQVIWDKQFSTCDILTVTLNFSLTLTTISDEKTSGSRCLHVPFDQY